MLTLHLERVHLLNHILKMIVEPNKTQHPDIQKLNLNVKKLEEITTEALSAFFADKENPANAKKRPYLNEIFKVAKQEERFQNGEIGTFLERCFSDQLLMPEQMVLRRFMSWRKTNCQNLTRQKMTMGPWSRRKTNKTSRLRNPQPGTA